MSREAADFFVLIGESVESENGYFSFVFVLHFRPIVDERDGSRCFFFQISKRGRKQCLKTGHRSSKCKPVFRGGGDENAKMSVLSRCFSSEFRITVTLQYACMHTRAAAYLHMHAVIYLLGR